MKDLPYSPSSVQTDIEFMQIESAAREAFGRGASVVRTSVQPDNGILVAINTQRTYGHFAILVYSRPTGGLHTGHYFDSIEEAKNDFDARDKAL